MCHVTSAVLAGTTTKFDDYYRKRWSYQTAILYKNGPVGKENNFSNCKTLIVTWLIQSPPYYGHVILSRWNTHTFPYMETLLMRHLVQCGQWLHFKIPTRIFLYIITVFSLHGYSNQLCFNLNIRSTDWSFNIFKMISAYILDDFYRT